VRVVRVVREVRVVHVRVVRECGEGGACPCPCGTSRKHASPVPTIPPLHPPYCAR
jgi:hypothetical protein